MSLAPSVTAAICTRNRPEGLATVVRSLLADPDPAFELMVVDQSDDERSAAALEPLRADPRLRYQRSSGLGVCLGRNEALRAARAALVVMTDDDCEAPQGWIGTMVSALDRHPTAALAFCVVEPGPHDPKAGLIPVYLRSGEALVTRLRDWLPSRGIAAGMAMRKDAVVDLGGFDEALGAYEERDMAVRALAAGRAVVVTDAGSVRHHGFRTWAEHPALLRRNVEALGAAHAKLLRSARPRLVAFAAAEAAWVLVRPALLWLRQPSPHSLLRQRWAAYRAGFAAGLRRPFDRRTLRFL